MTRMPGDRCQCCDQNMPQNFPTTFIPTSQEPSGGGHRIHGLMGYGETPPAYPRISVASVGGQIQLSWPAADHISWRLETRINSLLPAIDTAWTTVANSAVTNHITLPALATEMPTYFRLAYP